MMRGGGREFALSLLLCVVVALLIVALVLSVPDVEIPQLPTIQPIEWQD
jgi:hypothetical protein